MPRTLPWLRAQDDTQVKRESTPRKRVKTEATPDRDTTPRNLPVSPEKRDFFRSSQTPPSSPIKRCPSEEFLLEGLECDDGWVMVEDEFYSVAQTFTQHLHYAEYLRRRKEAKAKNMAAFGVIERPTDGRTPLPKEVERQREREALRHRQKSGLQQLDGQNLDEAEEHDEDDARWKGTHLHDLMTSPRKSRSLAGVIALKSSSRAAAGFSQAGQAPSNTGQARVANTLNFKATAAQVIELDEETASDSDDDLDIEPKAVRPPAPRSAHSTPQRPESNDVITPRASLQNKATSMPKVKPGNTRPVYKSRVQSLFDDLDGLPEPSQSIKYESTNIRRSPSNRQDKSGHSEVPTFLV